MENIIKFFGNSLAEIIGKTQMQGTGILRLAIKDSGKDPESLIPKEFEDVFKDPLKDRLKRSGIENSDEISKQMIIELKKNHELFIMSS